MFLHYRQQHAVGQGGFHSAVLRFNEARLHYVYDCGSDDTQLLNQRIDDFIEQTGAPRLAALFVSHFDRDHVSGLDVLLLKLKAENVILPYLSPFERICLLAESLRDGSLDSTYLDLLVDPTAWFGDRGVSRVIYINDDMPRDVALPETVELSVEDADDLLLAPHIANPRRVLNTRSGGTVNDVVIPYSTPLTIESRSVGLLNWQFLTFVHRASSEKLDRFQSRVIELLGNDIRLEDGFRLNSEQLSSLIKNYPKRIQLANAYREIWRNRNLTSMSVYSGPIQQQECQTLVWTAGACYRTALEKRCASLLTGDTNFQISSLRAAFLNHYEPILQYVLTVQIPHHGAAGCFHDELLEIPARTFVISAGKRNRYGHPHEEVIERIKSRVARTSPAFNSPNWLVDRESVSAADMPIVTEAPETALKEFVFLRKDFIKLQEKLSERYSPDWFKPFAEHLFTEYI